MFKKFKIKYYAHFTGLNANLLKKIRIWRDNQNSEFNRHGLLQIGL